MIYPTVFAFAWLISPSIMPSKSCKCPKKKCLVSGLPEDANLDGMQILRAIKAAEELRVAGAGAAEPEKASLVAGQGESNPS